MTFRNRLTNITPIRAGAKSVTTIGTGANAPTLDKLQFTLSGAAHPFTVNDIDSIVMYGNGRERLVLGSGAEHNAFRAYQGFTIHPTELIIDLTEPNARSGLEQFVSSWPLALMQDCRVELKLNAAAGADVGLECVAHVRPPTNNPFIKKQFAVNAGWTSGGTKSVYLPFGAQSGGKLIRVKIKETIAGNITKVELRAKNTVGFDCTRAEIENTQADHKLVPQAGWVFIDFIEDGNLNGWLDTATLQDVELKLTLTAADDVSIWYEYIDPLTRL